MEKINKTIEELSKEGWEDTCKDLGRFRIYKNGNERILYNPKDQSIEKKYTFDASKQ